MNNRPDSFSFVTNCLIKPRGDDGPLFVKEREGVLAFLNGYAIVPREEYEALLKDKP
jgi:hypothetical protein